MQTKFLIIFLFSFSYQFAKSQTLLEANGPNDTYELINSILAPGYDAVEEPDCNHQDFGRHIEEVYDTELGKYVFLFHIHKSPDNDRCQTFDRQRNEIKTYDKSPDSLLGVQKEQVEYKWKFKLDSDFQPSSSFTHLHQLKAVGGSESSMPLITLTARKRTPNKLELRHAESLSQSTIYQTDLAPLLGKWLEANELIRYDEVGLGNYAIQITELASGDTLLNYANNSIRTWKTDASFIRPKWGIYRSLNDSINLRDEQVLFADFSIKEIKNIVSKSNDLDEREKIYFYPNPAADHIVLSPETINNFRYLNIYNASGQLVTVKNIETKNVSISKLNNGLYFIQFRSNSTHSKLIKMLVIKY